MHIRDHSKTLRATCGWLYSNCYVYTHAVMKVVPTQIERLITSYSCVKILYCVHTYSLCNCICRQVRVHLTCDHSVPQHLPSMTFASGSTCPLTLVRELTRVCIDTIHDNNW